jgi:hypothetical protein
VSRAGNGGLARRVDRTYARGLTNSGGFAVLAKLRSYRPSHAVVVAYLALFVALGGSSYAAITVTGKNVKNSSLTGKDIKNNSLTGSDVKGIKSGDVSDGSLLAKDFKAGQLPSGAQGPKGDKGDAATKLFAYITDFGSGSTASVEYGSGVTAVSDSAGNGSYTVTFSRSLSNCVVQVLPGIGDPLTGSASTAAASADVVLGASAALDPDQARVTFYSVTNASVTDSAFMLTAFC